MGTPNYGSVSLRTRQDELDIRREVKRADHIRKVIRDAALDAKTPCVGSRASLCGGACCIECRRYVGASHFKRVARGRPCLDDGCEWCGRVNEVRVRPEGIDG